MTDESIQRLRQSRIVWSPRGSGKTTELLRYARDLGGAKKVAIVVPDNCFQMYIRNLWHSLFKGQESVPHVSVGYDFARLAGIEYVVADEWFELRHRDQAGLLQHRGFKGAVGS